jgi:hypothetical protein
MPNKHYPDLIAVLETQDLARAIERIEKGHGLRVVK